MTFRELLRRRARNHARRLRAPGPAVRTSGRGAAARAQPEPHAAVPGAVRAAEHAGDPGSDRRRGGRRRSSWTPRPRSSICRCRSPKATDGVRGAAEYNVDLFDRSTIERLVSALPGDRGRPSPATPDLAHRRGCRCCRRRSRRARAPGTTRRRRSRRRARSTRHVEAQVRATPERPAVDSTARRSRTPSSIGEPTSLPHHLRAARRRAARRSSASASSDRSIWSSRCSPC